MRSDTEEALLSRDYWAPPSPGDMITRPQPAPGDLGKRAALAQVLPDEVLGSSYAPSPDMKKERVRICEFLR